MTVIDLFAGPGGWDVAARGLGLDPIGLEWDDAACATRRAAGLRTMQCDVSEVDLEAQVTGWSGTGVRGLIASPPCQGFSTAGKRRGALDAGLIRRCAIQMGRGRDHRGEYASRCMDERSMLVVEPLRWALTLRPEWLAWEQVPPVLPFWELCAVILRRHGFMVWTGLLHAEQFGVPQTRKRAFLLASRVGAVAPPVPTYSRFHPRSPERLDEGVLPWVSMASALGWTAPGVVNTRGARKTAGGNEFSTDRPSYAMTSKARSWTLHTNRDQRADGSRLTRPVSDPAPAVTAKSGGQWKWAEERPAPTVGCSFGGVAGKQKNGHINLKVEEAAILQTFPPDYPWQGSRTKQFEQIGNAVPPMLAQVALQSVVPARQAVAA